MARSSGDAAALLDAISVRRDREHPFKLTVKSRLRRHFRVGLPEEFLSESFSAAVESAFESTLDVFRKLGTSLKRVAIPLLRETEDAGNQIAWAEATHYHQQAGWFRERSADYGEDVRERLELGAKVSATTYLQALELREAFLRRLLAVMTDRTLDALALPTTPIPAPLIGEETTRLTGHGVSATHPTRALLLRNNRPANLAGLPAISVPCGRTTEGLPIGLQLIGSVMDEALLLCMVHAFEMAHPPLA